MCIICFANVWQFSSDILLAVIHFPHYFTCFPSLLLPFFRCFSFGWFQRLFIKLIDHCSNQVWTLFISNEFKQSANFEVHPTQSPSRLMAKFVYYTNQLRTKTAKEDDRCAEKRRESLPHIHRLYLHSNKIK